MLCEVYNSSFKPVVGYDGYKKKENFMTFAKHFMAGINSRRVATMMREIRKGAQQAETIKELNKMTYPSAWQLSLLQRNIGIVLSQDDALCVRLRLCLNCLIHYYVKQTSLEYSYVNRFELHPMYLIFFKYGRDRFDNYWSIFIW
jgi:hypothetical protein